VNVSNTSTHKIRINNYIKESIVDGFGVRMVIFTQGCLLGCPFCHNPATHALDEGYIIEIDELRTIWKKNPLLQGITISGGEPFLQPDAVLTLLRYAHEDNLDVTVYSGYTFEDLSKRGNPAINAILDEAEYLIDGPFVYQLKDLNLLFRGSKNQRIIDLKETKKHNKVITYDEGGSYAHHL
jgi:anaerobic ribonucleoside-triphosphate reductase activating protein